MAELKTEDEIREAVRKDYAAAAEAASAGAQASCGPSGCGCGSDDRFDVQQVFGSSLYPANEREELPGAAQLASLGCGNPTAVAELHEGEAVLDLGSGGGIDVLLSARRVGPSGKAYGLDMTDEMLELARANQQQAGIENVEWLKGTIEEIPLPDDSVDVVISNCVINLSADKPQVLREAARVLRPGGRFAVTDIVADEDMDEATRHDIAAVERLRRRGIDRGPSSRQSLAAAGFERDRDPRDPSRPRAGRVGDRAGPQAALSDDRMDQQPLDRRVPPGPRGQSPAAGSLPHSRRSGRGDPSRIRRPSRSISTPS